MYSVCTVYSCVQCTVYSVQLCTVYSVQLAVYIVQCTASCVPDPATDQNPHHQRQPVPQRDAQETTEEIVFRCDAAQDNLGGDAV